MATVPLSLTRRNEIQTHIKAMAKADLKQEIPDFVETSELNAGRLLTLVNWWPVKPDIIDAVPKDWLKELTQGNLALYVLPRTPKMVKATAYASPALEDLDPLFTITYPHATDAWARPTLGWNTPATEIPIQKLGQLAATYPDVPGVAELLKTAEAWPLVQAHQQKWAAIEKQLMALLSEAKTVNSAVKAFPNLPFYLPPDIVTALRKEQVKAEKRVLDTSGLDLDTLTAVGVSAALTQGKE